MTEPYLIAHIVRGEPAFDIAIKLQIGDEAGWIIPTSGHRAYPWAHFQLNEIALGGLQRIHTLCGGAPTNHPDHYTTHATPGTGRTDLLSLIPLKSVEPIKRRV